MVRGGRGRKQDPSRLEDGEVVDVDLIDYH